MKDKVKNLQLIIILRSFFHPLISFSLFSLEHKNILEMLLRVLGFLNFKGKTILKSLFSRDMI